MYSVVQAELTRDEVDDVSVGVGVDTLLVLIGIDDEDGRRRFSLVRLRDQPFFVSSDEACSDSCDRSISLRVDCERESVRDTSLASPVNRLERDRRGGDRRIGVQFLLIRSSLQVSFEVSISK